MKLQPDALRLLQHLWRGGNYALLWKNPGKTSTWIKSGQPLSLPEGRYNIYFGVHPSAQVPPHGVTERDDGTYSTDPCYIRTQNKYVGAVNCLFAEFDGKDYSMGIEGALRHVAQLKPPPSVVVFSGGGFHAYWLFAEPFMINTSDQREYIKRLQSRWVINALADKGSKDLSRILRLPGTRNYKSRYAPNFPTVRTVRANYDWLYTPSELFNYLPKEKPKAPARSDYTIPEDIGRVLDALNSGRVNDYSDWITVGMALHQLGGDGLSMWEAWSQRSDKYTSGECSKKWNTFSTSGGITMRTLMYMAHQDGYHG